METIHGRKIFADIRYFFSVSVADPCKVFLLAFNLIPESAFCNAYVYGSMAENQILPITISKCTKNPSTWIRYESVFSSVCFPEVSNILLDPTYR